MFGRRTKMMGRATRLVVLFLTLGVPITAVATVDLEIVSFSGPAQAMPGEPIGDQIHLRIRNAGTDDVTTGFFVGFYISADTEITLEDVLLSGGREWVTALAAGAEVDVPLVTSAYIPTDYPLGPAFLGVIVDEFNAVPESDETDNTASSPVFVGEGVPVLVRSWGVIKRLYR
jgi:hypothetical protein